MDPEKKAREIINNYVKAMRKCETMEALDKVDNVLCAVFYALRQVGAIHDDDCVAYDHIILDAYFKRKDILERDCDF